MGRNDCISLVLFVIFCIIFVFCLSNTSFLQRTLSGESFDRIKTLNSKYLPLILADYLRQNHTQYVFYEIPNYIEELFTNNSDYYSIYKAKDKRTILLILPPDAELNKANQKFYNNLRTEFKRYPHDYNFIIISSDKHYNIKAYRFAYKDLQKSCKFLCVIDPINNTIFSLKKATDSDSKALEVILQQFAISQHN